MTKMNIRLCPGRRAGLLAAAMAVLTGCGDPAPPAPLSAEQEALLLEQLEQVQQLEQAEMEK